MGFWFGVVFYVRGRVEVVGGGAGLGVGAPPHPIRSCGAPLKRVNGGMVRSKAMGH